MQICKKYHKRSIVNNHFSYKTKYNFHALKHIMTIHLEKSGMTSKEL